MKKILNNAVVLILLLKNNFNVEDREIDRLKKFH